MSSIKRPVIDRSATSPPMSSSKEVTPKEKKRRTLKTGGDIGGSPTAHGEVKKIKQEVKIGKNELNRAKFYAEEEEAVKRDASTDIQIHNKCSHEIRKMMKEITEAKSSDNPDESAIEDKRIHASLQFVALKKLNRLAHMRCKKARDSTNEAKQTIDHHHLQLQNLLYEVVHLQKEITKCLMFKSKDEEIDLVSLDDFYKDAPEGISKPSVTKKDEHQQTLARLDWELEQRKQLSSKLEEASKNKEVISEEIKTKREHLENLQPKLKAILQSTKPVQDYLQMPFDEIKQQQRVAHFLPSPLFVLYMQSSAYKDSCDEDISVSIEGDIDEAKAMNSATPEVEEDSDSDQEEQEKKKSKHRRRTTGERSAQRRAKLLRKHPLSVIIQIKCQDGTNLELTFHYLVAMSIVTVFVKLSPGKDTLYNTVAGGDLLSPDNLLSCLYHQDQGLDTPNQSNHFDLSRLGMDEFSSYLSQVGRPYLWVQRLAGLQFLQDLAPEGAVASVSTTHIDDTICRLRQRVNARLALQKQLASLERCSVPLTSEYENLFPGKVSSKLTSWKRSTYEDFQAASYTQSLQESGLVQSSDMFFTVHIERGSAKACVQVALGNDYPNTAPMFAVQLSWKTERNSQNDDNIKALESEVNIHYDELVKENSPNQLLTNQVQRLLMCLDVYLETETNNASVEGPAEFSKEKMYLRITRGPYRMKPYKYVHFLGCFCQR